MSDTPKINPIVPVHMMGPVDQSAEIAKRAAVVRAVQYLNRTEYSPEKQQNYLAHSYDAATGREIIKVLDRHTKGVLFQIPSEEVLRMAADARRAKARSEAAVAEDGEA